MENKVMLTHLEARADRMKQPIRWLFAVGILFYATFSWAGIEAIYGDWEGGGSATVAIFGTMTITNSHLSWQGQAQGEPRCTVAYRQIPEGFGVKFKDQLGREYVTAPDSRFQTFLLMIDDPKRCALGITHFRMTLHERFSGRMLDEVDYRGLDNPRGWGHFFRKMNN